jgi:GTP-dependent phosphoenolpyruvate carboxykinase
MAYTLNLDISPKKVVKGAVQVFLNWHTRQDGQTEPALVFRQANRGRALYVLPMSYMHNVMASSGYGLLSIVSLGAEIAAQIGFARMDRMAAKDVADAILEYTDDLFHMPGDPPTAYEIEVQQAARQTAELEIKIDGQTVMEAEVPA